MLAWPPQRRVLAAGAVVLVLVVAAVLALRSGGGDERGGEGGQRLPVAASFYPLRELAEQIGGERVNVTDLTPVGGEPQGALPVAAAEGVLRRSRVVLYLGKGFQPQLAEALATVPRSTRRVDLLDGLQLLPAPEAVRGTTAPAQLVDAPLEGDLDPHVWLDPVRFAAMASRVRDALIAADPSGREGYEQRTARYVAQLRSLDAAFRGALQGCASDRIVAAHPAYGYLAARYGLKQASMPALAAPQPSPRALRAARAYVRANDATTVYFRAAVPSSTRRTIADEVGAGSGVLNAIEGLTADQLAARASYVTLQRQNGANLASGLRCAPR